MLIKLTDEIYVNPNNITNIKISDGMYDDPKLLIYFVGEKDVSIRLRKEDLYEHADELIKILNK